MKYLKFNSVKVAIVITILYNIIQVLAMNALALLKKDTKQELIRGVVVVVLSYLFMQMFLFLKEAAKANGTYYIYRNYHKNADKYYLNMGIINENKEGTGEKTALYVNDIPRITSLTFERMINMIGNFVLIIFILISLIKINIVVGFLGVLMVASQFWVSFLLQEGLTNAISESQEINKKYLSKLTELFRAFSLLFELNIKEKFSDDSEEASQSYSRKSTDIDKYAGKISALLNFTSQFFAVLILGGISFLVIEHNANAGLPLAALSMVVALGDAATLFYSDRAFYKSGKHLFKEKFKNIEIKYYREFIKPCLSTKYRRIKEEAFVITSEPIESIRINDLCVQLGGNNISFPDITFENGKKYAVTGKSGCGKSTLLKAIIGHIKDYSGKIYINGEEKTTSTTLYDRIAYVSQESFVFNCSVDDNLKIVDNSVDTENILKELELSALARDYTLGENGSNISGGQKQRIAIARAILRNKNVFLLDEITANLDSDSKRLIEKMILTRNAMVIWVTHDLNDENIGKFDYVINL